ncbi:MAG: hypothetical protein HQK49_06780 [Oligoflexia bacterium]|nr:hypothetical protein [Oligoflexia bacterium]
MIILQNKNSYYIPNFSGPAFEFLIKKILLTENAGDDFKAQKYLLDELGLPDNDIIIYDLLDGENDVDMVIEHKKDRKIILIECKWSKNLTLVKEGIKQLENASKKFDRRSIKMFLTVS